MSLQTLDWRRRVLALYAEVRAESDPAAAHELWWRGRDVLLSTHPASPVRAGERATYPGADIAPYDPDYRFVCRVEDAERTCFKVPTITDGIVSFDRIGKVSLPGLGSLDVWWLHSYGGGIFVPVKDGLAGRGTYGGGRYLLDTVKGADLGSHDGDLVIDLNFAYQPSCAYDPLWICPLAPTGNVLAVEVPVGERYRTI